MERFWRFLLRARPRRVENRVAEELTQWSRNRGDYYVFQRWPAMGRTGPDLYHNPYGFVVDVKSRQAISDKPFTLTSSDRTKKLYVHDKDGRNGMYVCRLDNFEAMFKLDWEGHQWHSKVVDGWLENMRSWAGGNTKYGIGMLVLHKPRKPIGSSVAVMSTYDWLRTMEAMRLI